MDVLSASSQSLFVTAAQATAVRENVALRQLDAALGQFSSGQYERAIESFKRAISQAPGTATAVNAYDYMARAYLTLGNPDAAIEAYNGALKISPFRADIHFEIGKIHTTLDQPEPARDAFERAARYDPSAANLYSLGQGYLATGQYDLARRQFERVIRLEPDQPYGHFGLGQTLAKQGKFDAAISEFRQAIAIQPDYLNAFSEMGYALVDSGDLDAAQQTADFLYKQDVALGTLLIDHIYANTAPSMTATYQSSQYTPFISTFRPGTAVSTMGAELYAASASQTFSIKFQFSKPMDERSVESVSNWHISRSTGSGIGDAYNYGLTVPDTEVTLAATPSAVIYDPTTWTATVLFTITQNATADGTLDPSHIVFSFQGTDVGGLAMDSQADAYSGFSGFA